MDERGNALITAQSAKSLFGFQESCGHPAQRHLCIAIAGNSAAHTLDHGIRRLDGVGGGQAACQLAGDAQPVDR